MAKKLFLYLSEFAGTAASGLAAIWSMGSNESQSIDTLPDMVKALGVSEHYDTVVIYIHGVPGGIIFDDEAFALDEAKLATELKKTKAQIDHIRFEGCWVGLSPKEMAVFGRIFGAKSVSGYTWVSWTGEVEVTLPKGVTAAALTKVLEDNNLNKWLMPKTASVAALAPVAKNAAVKKKLPLLWYQKTLERKPPYEGRNYDQSGRMSYRARQEATARTVAAAKAVNNADPVAPFEYVTVTL